MREAYLSWINKTVKTSVKERNLDAEENRSGSGNNSSKEEMQSSDQRMLVWPPSGVQISYNISKYPAFPNTSIECLTSADFGAVDFIHLT